MLSLKNVSVHAFRVAMRWATINKFPKFIIDWSPEQSKRIQAVADECDRRRKVRYEKN